VALNVVALGYIIPPLFFCLTVGSCSASTVHLANVEFFPPGYLYTAVPCMLNCCIYFSHFVHVSWNIERVIILYQAARSTKYARYFFSYKIHTKIIRHYIYYGHTTILGTFTCLVNRRKVRYKLSKSIRKKQIENIRKHFG
jgi:hypothetical protein